MTIGGAGLTGDESGDVDDREDGVVGDGVECVSCKEVGDQVVRSEALDIPDVEEQLSEVGDCEDLLNVLENVEEALLKNDFAGDVVIAGVCGSVANGIPGMLISFRTTIREMCNRFRANLFET